MSTQNKYRSIRTNGFHSKKEAKRYAELRLLENAGLVCDIQCQRRYPLEVSGILVGFYVLDFAYFDHEKEKEILEDVKGYKKGCAYELFKLKKNLMRAIYSIEIQEV